MSNPPALECVSCRASWPADRPVLTCECGGLLQVLHDSGPVPRALFEGRRASRERLDVSGVWRFRELVHPELDATSIVTLGEGWTPLLPSAALSESTGVDELFVKHEGWNPTGSFKDRGMTVAVSQARRRGAELLVCASTGNTAASLAAYAAAAGVRCAVLAPAGGVSRPKISQAAAAGARVIELRGDFDDAMRLVREQARALGAALVNSIDPWRVEGQKTIVFELLDDLAWEPPDWIAVPAGNLGNTAAFGKALREARAHGWIERAPRLLAVQAAGAAPFARSFERGFDGIEAVEAETWASAIRIGDPVSYPRAVPSILETNGLVIAVDDEEIRAAKRAADRAGVGAEPASCASIAGVARAVREGHVRRDERVVCVLTGHFLKDTAAADVETIEIDATPRALRGALESHA